LTRTLGLGGALALALLFAAPAADAATVGIVPGADGVPEYTFSAGPGEPNALTISDSGPRVTFLERSVTVSGDASCIQMSEMRVDCPQPEGDARLVVNTGDEGDDVETEIVAGGPFTHSVNRFDGGSGDDYSINGTPGPDVISGGEGNDQLLGGDGNDRVEGGLVNDAL
jgi:Ca2+-binding RTX toxin-like protein